MTGLRTVVANGACLSPLVSGFLWGQINPIHWITTVKHKSFGIKTNHAVGLETLEKKRRKKGKEKKRDKKKETEKKKKIEKRKVREEIRRKEREEGKKMRNELNLKIRRA